MRKIKMLAFVVVLFSISSCSNENSTQNNTSNKIGDSQDLLYSINMKSLIKSTKTEIKALENESGFFIKDRKLVVGKLVDNQFLLSSGIQLDILKKFYKLNGLQVGYDVEFSDFQFLSKEDNEGYDMLISKGISNKSDEDVSIGLDLIVSTNGDVVLKSGSSVVCVGCRRGCSPKRDSEGDGYCTDCKINNSNCTKTETEGLN